jgi:hypothetical protein
MARTGNKRTFRIQAWVTEEVFAEVEAMAIDRQVTVSSAAARMLEERVRPKTMEDYDRRGLVQAEVGQEVKTIPRSWREE